MPEITDESGVLPWNFSCFSQTQDHCDECRARREREVEAAYRRGCHQATAFVADLMKLLPKRIAPISYVRAMAEAFKTLRYDKRKHIGWYTHMAKNLVIDRGFFGRGPVSKALRFAVLRRDRYTCRYCGAVAPNARLEIDHVVPVSKGGGSVIDNLVTSCFDCNRGKRDGSAAE